MDWNARLRRLEKLFPPPPHRVSAADFSDAQIHEHGGWWLPWSGVWLPALPWSDATRAAIHAFFDKTVLCGEMFPPFGFHRYQLQSSMHHTAVNAGLEPIPGWHPMDESPSLHEDDRLDLGPFSPTAGETYRHALMERWKAAKRKEQEGAAAATSTHYRRTIERES